MSKRLLPLLLIGVFALSFSFVQAQSSCSSGGSGVEVQFTAPNFTSNTLDVFWIDYSCAEQFVQTINPGEIFYQTTYDGHQWIIRDNLTGADVQQFTISAAQPVLSLGGGIYSPQPVQSNCSSMGTTQEVRLTVINNTTDSIVLNWIDFNCVEQPYQVAEGNTQIVQSSYVGHDWVVRFKDGKTAAQVTVSATGDTIIIDPPPTATQPTATPASAAPPPPPAQPNTQPNTQPNAPAQPAQNATLPGEGVLLMSKWMNNDYQLALVNLDGSIAQQLNQAARWGKLSPDGNRIVFHSDRDGDNEIFVMDADGANLRQITDNTFDDRHAVFTSDGSRIIFSSNRDGNFELYIMNTDGYNTQRLTNNTEDDRGPSMSPDGTRIAFHRGGGASGGNQVYIMNMDGSNLQQITNTTNGSNSFPRFSPDGTQITFHSSRDDGQIYEIYVVNVDGTNPQRLTSNTQNDVFPFFSPDGSMILYVNYQADDTPAAYRVNVDASGLQSVAANSEVFDWTTVMPTNLQGNTSATNPTTATNTVTCSIQAQGANTRAEPNTQSNIAGSLTGYGNANGQKIGADGAVWYRLDNNTWIRNDVVFAESSCANLPTVP